MVPNPIRKVLSLIHKHRVRALRMGGQACVCYGTAEVSFDTDLALLASATAGSSREAKVTMMAMTTSNLINVNLPP